MPRKYRRRSTLGTIESRGSKYRIKWTDANKQRKSESGFNTYQEADEKLLSIQLGMSSPKPGLDWSRYWDVHVRPTLTSLARKTEHEYVRQWEHDLKPRLGSLKICDTDWRAVQAVIDDIPSSSVQRHAFSLLRKVCNMAVRDGLMNSNPCERSIRLKQHQKRSKALYDAQEIMSLMDGIRGYKYEPAILLMLACGLRVEECLALDWEDIEKVELYGNEYLSVTVNKTFVLVGSTPVEQETTKNESSIRTVLVGEPFASRIAEIGEGRSGAIVGNGTGGRTSPSTVSHNWKGICERNGIKYVPLGNMRSVFATVACESADSSLVSLMMGHSDGTTRGRNYQSATLRGMAIVADSYGEHLMSTKQVQFVPVLSQNDHEPPGQKLLATDL